MPRSERSTPKDDVHEQWNQSTQINADLCTETRISGWRGEAADRNDPQVSRTSRPRVRRTEQAGGNSRRISASFARSPWGHPGGRRDATRWPSRTRTASSTVRRHPVDPGR